MHIDTIQAADCARAAFTIDAGEFHAAAKLLSGKLIERRNTIPILSYIRIVASPCGQVELTATNLDQQATITLAGDVESPGAICVQGDVLADALAKATKTSKGARAVLQDIDGRAVLKCGRLSVNLASLPIDDFPVIAMPALDTYGPTLSGELSLPADTLLRDLATLAPVMDKASHRYYIQGVAIQRRELSGRDCLAFVATDGGNIAAALRGLPEGAPTLPDMILPAAAVLFLKAAAKGLAGEAVARFDYLQDGRRGAFTIGNVELRSKMIDGTYPDWGRFYSDPAPIGEADASAPMFPDLLPGAPIAAMGVIAKACPVAVDWKPEGQMFIGRAAGDAGLFFASMACADWSNPGVKGFSFRVEGEAAAESYLLALVQSRGLVSIDAMASRCQAANKAWEAAGTLAEGYGAQRYGADSPLNWAEPCKAELHVSGERVLGATISGRTWRAAWTETVTDWDTLAERDVYHESESGLIEGSYSILMPTDGPGTLTVKGDGEIVGPDGVAYPVAINERAIHLTKDQVRALMDSPENWQVVAFPGPDGKPRYVSKWLWESGAPTFGTVQANGRTWKEVKASGWGYDQPGKEMWSREAIEAALAGEPASPVETCEPVADLPAPTVEVEAKPIAELPASAPEGTEAALSAVSGPSDTQNAPTGLESGDLGQSEPAADPLAAIMARLDALEAAIAGALSVKSGDAETVTPSGEVARPKRTAAHERAIRRAWAERRERLTWMHSAMMHSRTSDRQSAEYRELEGELQRAKVERDAAIASAGKYASMANTALYDLGQMKAKRRRAVLKARDLQTRLHAEHKRVDRANERRETANRKWRAAEVANAALQQRAERAETAAGQIAGRIAAIESHLHRATA